MRTTANQLPSHRQAWIICLTGALLFFYQLLQMNILNSMATNLSKDLALSPAQLGVVSGVFFLTMAALALPAGMLIPKVSLKKLISYLMLASSLTALFFGIFPSYYTLVGMRFIQGIIHSFALTCCIRLATQWLPPKKLGLANGLIIMVGMTGAVAAQYPVSWLLSIGPWQNISLINGGLGLFLSVIVALIVKDGPLNKVDAGSAPSSWQGLLEVLQRPINWLASLYTCFLNLPIMIFGTLFGNWYLVSTYGVSNQEASMTMSIMYLGFIIGCPIIGWCFDKIPNTRRLMMLGVTTQVLLLASLAFLPEHLSATALTILFFGIGFSSSAHTLSYPLIALENTATSASIGLSLSALVIFAGTFCSQPIFGYLLGDSLETPNFGYALTWLMGITALGLVASSLIRQRKYQSNNS